MKTRSRGRDKEREGFNRLMDALRAGDVLVVWKLDRLARSLKQLMEVMERLNQLGADLQVLTQNIDTTTPAGRMMFGIFAVIAEFERDLIRERTLAGLSAARARGRLGGRPRKMTARKLKVALALLREQKLSVSSVVKELGISRSTLYAYVRGDGVLTEQGERFLARG